MKAYELFKKMCADLLKSSRKTPNFVEQTNTQLRAYENMIRQQNVLLDEYEDLIQAYEKNNQDSGSSASNDTSRSAPADSVSEKENT